MLIDARAAEALAEAVAPIIDDPTATYTTLIRLLRRKHAMLSSPVFVDMHQEVWRRLGKLRGEVGSSVSG